MKKRGFTLVELLAVIIILAIIILLAVSGFREVSKKVKEKSYDNLISYIETKAGDYANDTGNLITNVDNLVKLGYIEADDEEGNVKSPIDGIRLNCHIVSIRKEENSLYGQYSNEEECQLKNLELINLGLGINVYTTSDNTTMEEKIEPNTWTNKNIILEAYLGEKIKVEEVTKIIWQSNTGRDEREVKGDFYNQNKYLVTAEQIVNTEYEVTITIKDGASYHTQVEVKIDKQRPIIYNTYIENENSYTSYDKKVTLTASDGNGSGIYGYYVGENPNCLEVEYEANEKNTYETSKDVGEYYVCVKDKAGNVSEDISTRKIEVKYIDKTPPKVTIKKDPLTLGNEEYEFKNNLEVDWGETGEGEISCNPAISKKTGVYNVTCTVIGNNGLSTEVGFEVKHNYPAEVENYACTIDCNPHSCTTCVNGHPGACCPGGGSGEVGTCNCPPGAGANCSNAICSCIGGYEIPSTCYDKCDSICQRYICPNGGTLNGDTCYY